MIVRKLRAVILLATLAASDAVLAQSPSGAIAGVVRDPAGAIVPGTQIKLTHLATGLTRVATTSSHGDYSFHMLPASEYALSAELEAFGPVVLKVTVEAGVTTRADFDLVVGVNESITVEDVSPQMRYDSHTVGNVITQRQIQGVPLNGRNFLEVAKLEPGVQPPTRAGSNRTFVPALGQPQGNNGRGTRVTVDGGSIMTIGNGGSAMGFSQEVVQEFQVATVNFDLTTGITNGASINVVTRSGGNEFNGTAFYFFRDHKLSAYPLLKPDPDNPDPFFQRRQFGFGLGGPVLRNRVFFFGNFERNEQRGVVATALVVPEFAHLNRTTASPYFGTQLGLRLDARVSDNHTVFIRYSHDGVRAFGPPTTQPSAYPSFWQLQPLWADQSILGLTSGLSDTLVNDLRFSYFFVSTSTVAPTERDCPDCLGVGAPSITVADTNLSVGRAGIIQQTLARRFHVTDYMTWQESAHRMRFGVDWEYNRGGTFAWDSEPAALTLFSPLRARQAGIPLPATFLTLNDILQLPLQSVTVGIGDFRVPQEDGGLVPDWNTVRLFFQDTWRLNSRLTVNYGLGWSVDHSLNNDLSKPDLLSPILGPEGLGPSRTQWNNFSPVLGMAWAPSSDGKSVIRAGAGIFYDWVFNPNLTSERALLGPAGRGRTEISGSRFRNCLPNIPGVAEGTPLNFRDKPTRFTGADLLICLPAIRAELTHSLASADGTIKAIQLTKSTSGSSGLNPVDVPRSAALHFNVGIQREIARDFVVSADFAYRRFDRVGLGPLDQNHFNSARGPVIRTCLTDAERNDPHAICSAGPINVQANVGISTYKGLLVRADKRFSRGFQFLASWAYSSNTGTIASGQTTALSPGFNLDDWRTNHGPRESDITHIVNLAGVIQLPWRFQAGFNFSYASAPPFTAYVAGSDFNGDGTANDLLPGTTVNAFNRGMGPSDLERLVAQFNQSYAGKLDSKGVLIPRLLSRCQRFFSFKALFD